jgi:hypothetical protein
LRLQNLLIVLVHRNKYIGYLYYRDRQIN